MRIVIVAMSNSIHTARWLDFITDLGWEIHLFPSIDNGISHSSFRNITVHHSIYSNKTLNSTNVKIKGIRLFYPPLAGFCLRWIGKLFPNYRLKQLKKLIKQINPNCIHTMETQEAGYLVSKLKKMYKYNFPTWIHTIWGSDLYLFGKLKEHQAKITNVLVGCDHFIYDGDRDLSLAKQFGLKNKAHRMTYVAGSINISLINKFKTQFNKPHKRKKILVKGNQSWSGRGLFALSALAKCTDLLKEYKIIVYNASQDMKIASELFQARYEIPVTVFTSALSDEEMVKNFGNARLFIGLSISDGVPTAMLEAMGCGAFPIHSNTCNYEGWGEDGKNFILVGPENVSEIEAAIRKALTNDSMVDDAAQENQIKIETKFEINKIKNEVLSIYNDIST